MQIFHQNTILIIKMFIWLALLETCLVPNQNIFTQNDIFILAQANDISVSNKNQTKSYLLGPVFHNLIALRSTLHR